MSDALFEMPQSVSDREAAAEARALRCMDQRNRYWGIAHQFANAARACDIAGVYDVLAHFDRLEGHPPFGPAERPRDEVTA